MAAQEDQSQGEWRKAKMARRQSSGSTRFICPGGMSGSDAMMGMGGRGSLFSSGGFAATDIERSSEAESGKSSSHADCMADVQMEASLLLVSRWTAVMRDGRCMLA